MVCAMNTDSCIIPDEVGIVDRMGFVSNMTCFRLSFTAFFVPKRRGAAPSPAWCVAVG